MIQHYLDQALSYGQQFIYQGNVATYIPELANADKRVTSMRWQNFGDITPMKNIKDRLSKTYPSSRFVQKNNIVKFNSFSLSWTENKGWVERLGLSQVQFQFNTKDLGYWSTIKRERGTDYPFAWTFDFTLAVSF